MATQVSDNPSHPDSSTVAVGCATHALDGEQRQYSWGVQVLARIGPVTELSARLRVSWKFRLYRQIPVVFRQLL